MQAATDFQKTFTNYDLRNFFYSSSLGRYDLRGFKPRNAWILQALLTLYAAGAASIRCNRVVLGELCERIAGFGYSTRTLSTALADVEALGFCKRKTYRHGGELRIELSDRLAELLSRDKLKRCDKQLHGKGLQPGEKDRSKIPVPSGSSVFKCEIPARVIEVDHDQAMEAAAEQAKAENHKKKPNKRKSDRQEWHPLARSIWYASKNFALVSLAMNEIRHGGRSGVDWDYWAGKWDMSTDAREHIARTVFIPALQAVISGDPMQPTPGGGNPANPDNKRVSIIENALNCKIVSGRAAESPPANTPPADPEMRALWEAAERSKKRAADLKQWDYQAALVELQRDCFRKP